MRIVLIFIVIIAITISSCFSGTYRTLLKVEVPPIDNYEIKSMSGCCGCKALLYNAYRNSQLAEQFVVETSCGLYEPTKHFFTVDSKGKVKSYKSLIAVTNNSFTLPVSELDKRAFEQIDSIYKVWTGTNKRQIMFTKISGFREGDKIHMPLGIESITNPKK